MKLDRVEQDGGKILEAKILITEIPGHHALIIDSERNRIALHSMY
jgi:predicted enzyme related to lactoylglutathione lyase